MSVFNRVTRLFGSYTSRLRGPRNASAARTFRSATDITGSAAILFASIERSSTDILTDISTGTSADIVRSVSASESCAWNDCDDGLTSATGIPGNSKLLTSQSSAFLREPGTPCAYSGVEMSSASASPTRCRNSATDGWATSPSRSRSGLKWGSVSSPAQLETVTPGGATSAAACTIAELDDAARRLPEIARIITASSYSTAPAQKIARAENCPLTHNVLFAMVRTMISARRLLSSTSYYYRTLNTGPRRRLRR